MGKAIIFTSDNQETNNRKNEHMKMKTLLLITIVTLGLTASTMAQNLPNYVPSNGLVGWWPFYGNANDESGNNNNGTLNGAILTSDRFGNGNSAYGFGGSDFITVPENNLLDLTDNFSISSWFNAFSFPENSFGGPINLILCKRQNIPSDIIDGFGGYGVWESNGNHIVSTQSYPNSGAQNYSSANFNIQDSVWYNYVVTYDDITDSLKYYLNGTLIFNEYLPLEILNNSYDMFIGALGSTPTYFWNGKIDDIGIWNRTLTQQEITDLNNGNICYQTITVTDTLLINMGITGFNPVTYNNTIKIYPNPANNHITVDYGNFATMNGCQLKIENSLGQQLFQTNITQQTDYLSLNNWGGNGLYFVHIIDAQGNTIDIRKIVLQ